MGQDIIMMNPNSKPAICKALDYSEFLQEKFIKEVINKERENENQKKEKQSKQLKFSHKITMSDLKLKVRFAKEMSIKFRKFIINIQCLEN